MDSTFLIVEPFSHLLTTSQGASVPEESALGDTDSQKKVQALILDLKDIYIWSLPVFSPCLPSSVPLQPPCPPCLPRSLLMPCILLPLPGVPLFLCPGVSAWQIAPSSISCFCKRSLNPWAYSDMLSTSFLCWLVHSTV